MTTPKKQNPEGIEIIEVVDMPLEKFGRDREALAKSKSVRSALKHPPSGRSPSSFQIRPAGEVKPVPALCIARRPDAQSSQQYRWLKYRLKEGSDPRLIGVTSPRPGEGKTTVAANLGLALAEGRRSRIVLLDLNLRSPALNEMFGVRPNIGVAEQLRQKHFSADFPWEMLELGSRLHLLGGVQSLENPASLLNSEEISQLLLDLSEQYDYIVVDLPAVLLGADAKIVQEQLDGIVLVCQSGISTRDAMNLALNQLGPSKIQGVIMLSVPNRYISR